MPDPKMRHRNRVERVLLTRLFLFFVLNSPFCLHAQWSASFSISNQIQVSQSVYEFDVFLKNASSQSFRLHSYQFGLGIDTAVIAGGNLQVQYIDGSCQLTNPAQAPFWQYDSSTASVFTNINVGISIFLNAGRYYRYINCTAILPPLFTQASILPVSSSGCPQPGIRIGRFRAVNSVPFRRSTRPFHVFSEVNAAGVTRSVVSIFLSPTTQQFLYPNASSNALELINWNTNGSCDVNPLFNCRDSISFSASICAPDSFWMGGVAYTASGNYQASLLNSFGCDSIVSLTLTVFAPPNAGILSGADSVCVGSTSMYSSSVSGGIWSSTNPAVLSISPTLGQVTALTAGVAVIIYSMAGTGVCPSTQAFQIVAVNAPPQAGLLIGADSVCVGASSLFSSTVSGGVWSSSDTSILRVSSVNGLATGHSAGVANLLYTVNGLGGCPPAQVLKSVVVSGRPNAPILTLSINSDTIFSNTSYGNRWFRDGVHLAFYNDSGYIVNPTNGNYRCIRVGFLNCESDSSNLLSFWSSEVQNFARNFLSVAPNPNMGEFEVKFELLSGQILDIVVTNAMGKRCDIMVDHWVDLPDSLRVRLKNPNSGMYFLCIIFSDLVADCRKVIVQ